MAGGAVFFDVDGTLVDTTYFHAVAWWRALDAAGEGQPMSRIHPLIGMGGEQLLGELFGELADPDGESLRQSQAKEFARFHGEIRPLPGAADLVRCVAERGLRAVVVTSARPDDIDALLGPLGVAPLIDGVVDSSAVERTKPAPDLFAVALERTGLDPGATVAVGDSVWDVEAAGRSGLGCVGLVTGGINRRDLTDAGALAVYDDCVALLDGFDASPLGRLAGAGRPPS